MTLAILLLMVGVTGRLIPRLGFKPLAVAGLVVLGAGIALFARVPAGGGYAADVLGASLVAALGMSLAYIPVLVASLSGAKPEEAGLASGLINTSYQVGSALGLAAVTAAATAAGGSPGASLTHSYHVAFAVAAGFAALGALVAVGFIRRPRGVSEEVGSGAPELDARPELAA